MPSVDLSKTFEKMFGGKLLVTARVGDLVAQRGRARLIWASQTAQAAHDLGVPTILAGGIKGLPFKYDGPDGRQAVKRYVSTFYNVAADFDVRGLYGPPSKDGKQPHFGSYELETELARYVLPEVGLVHTRDPRLASLCASRRLKFIYEDHEEDYHTAVGSYDKIGVTQEHCLACVAITGQVKNRLIANGVPESKVIVADSGVNARAFVRDDKRAQRWRQFLLETGKSKIVSYCGGLQEERGISQVMDMAQINDDVLFVLAGGSKTDCAHCRSEVRARGLSNVKVLGYVPQSVAIELQQASDVLIMTRQAGQRTQITSPLKFFEYLAAGRPIVAPKIDALLSEAFAELKVEFYEPGCLEDLAQSLERALNLAEFTHEPIGSHLETAANYTWHERQKTIFEFCGLGI